MGMRDYAVDDYGLVLDIDSDILYTIAKNLYDDCTKKAWDEEKWEFIEGIRESLDLCYFSGFNGEAFSINDIGLDKESSHYYNDDAVLYLGVWHYPTLFNSAYHGFDDLIDEFKHRIGEYLPLDFDYRNNILHIVGTYCG